MSKWSDAALGGISVGGTITSGTAGSVLFIDPTNTIAQDNSQLYWDNSNNRLGIGINTPQGKLHVSAGNPGAFTPDSDADDLIFQSTGDCGASFICDSSGVVRLNFGTPTDTRSARVLYSASSNIMFVGTDKVGGQLVLYYGDSTEGARIDDNGRFQIGDSTSGIGQLHVKSASASRSVTTFYGAVSQSANLTEWQDSAGSVLASIDSAGRLGVGTGTPDSSSVITLRKSTSGSTQDFIRLENPNTAVDTGCGIAVFNSTADPGPNDVVGRLSFVRGAADQQRLDLSLYNATTGLENVFSIETYGNGFFKVFAPFVLSAPGETPLHCSSSDSSKACIRFADQTVTVEPKLGGVGNDLVFFTDPTGGGSAGLATTERMRIGQTSQNVLITSGSSSLIGLTVKGAASQSANLQEWQNSSASVLSVIDSAGKLGVGDSTPSVSADVNGGLAIQSSSVSLTADNQAVTVGDRSHIVLSSDDATATNRTFTLSNGLGDGQVLVLEWSGTNAAEIVAATNIKLSATWTPTQYDTLSLIWSTNATAWLETSRSANA